MTSLLFSLKKDKTSRSNTSCSNLSKQMNCICFKVSSNGARTHKCNAVSVIYSVHEGGSWQVCSCCSFLSEFSDVSGQRDAMNNQAHKGVTISFHTYPPPPSLYNKALSGRASH